ncbi:MAG: hypothetical protein AB7K24_28000 [Gemmataceae bacterium]
MTLNMPLPVPAGKSSVPGIAPDIIDGKVNQAVEKLGIRGLGRLGAIGEREDSAEERQISLEV